MLLAGAASLLMSLFAWAGVETAWAVIGPATFLFLGAGFVQMALGASAGSVAGRFHDGTTRPMSAVIPAACLLGLASYALRVRRPRTREVSS